MHIDIARCEARPRPRLGRDARCEARPRPSRRLPSWLSEVGRHSGGTRAVLLRAFPTLFRRDVLVVEARALALLLAGLALLVVIRDSNSKSCQEAWHRATDRNYAGAVFV